MTLGTPSHWQNPHNSETKLSKSNTNHRKAVTDPETLPVRRTVGDLICLAVQRERLAGHVTDDAATDVLRDLLPIHRHHRYRRSRRQPVRLVIATRVVAHVVEVAKNEWHRAELL